jgi:CO/xanthine dehydrogenase FAD-binding subunit
MYVPESKADLLTYLKDHGADAKLLCNGSDLIPRIRRGDLKPKLLVDLSGLKEFKYVKHEDGKIKLGALTTINELTSTPILKKRYAIFQEVADLFGAYHIRNVATVGGNIGAAASSEDLIPILMALNATVKLTSAKGDRNIPIEKLVVGKRKLDIHPDEFIAEAYFDDIGENGWTAFEKIGRRRSLIIALVSLALVVKLNSSTRVVEDVRMALNRVKGKIPERAANTEGFLKGKVLDDKAIEEAAEVLKKEVSLTSDYRASSNYRVEMVGATLRRALRRCRDRILGA